MNKSSKHKIIEAIIGYDQSLKKEWGKDPGLDEMGFSDDPKANQLLIEDSNAFVFAVIFDQGIAAEKAWTAPYLLKRRLGGTLDLNVIVEAGPEELRRLVRQKPALHRFHYLGDWIFKASELTLRRYKGDASNIWNGKPSAAMVVRRFEEFVGIGQKKANMAVKILKA